MKKNVERKRGGGGDHEVSLAIHILEVLWRDVLRFRLTQHL